MLLDGSAHPVDLGITTDGLVVRIDHDNLEVLVGGVLTHPVRVENSQALNTSSDTLLGDGLKIPDRLLLLDTTRSLGLAIRTTLGVGAFATSTTHGNAEDDKALLVLVAETTGLIGSGGPWHTVNLGQLAILPASDTKQVSHHIALLLAIQLAHVLVRAHRGRFLVVL